jgi:hypothetical protein
MSFPLSNFGVYDILLMIVVVLMIVGVSYLKHPRWKAFIMLLPLPSTVATLSLGKPVDASFLIGLPLVMLFFCFIYFLYKKLGVNIVIAIIISTISYGLTGILILPFLSTSPLVFWIIFLFVISFGVVLYNFMPEPNETGHRTMLPLYIKIPVVVIVVFLLINMKYLLGGFMPMFPMVGVLAAYEARHCLKTVFSQIPSAIMALAPMFAVCYLTQNIWGLYGGLGLGWLVYLVLLLFTRKMWLPE